MKAKGLITFLIVMIAGNLVFGQNIKDFTLKDVNGKAVSLSQYASKKAVVVIFTSNHCPYSKKYEQRILKMANNFTSKDVQFILINSNDPSISEEEKVETMKARSEALKMSFPYLKDGDKKVSQLFKATKTPQAFLLKPSGDSFSVYYTGNIDDNALMPDRVQKKFLEEAINALLAGNPPEKPKTEVVGCNIR